MTTNPNKSLTIVTGCDSTHAKSQLNFLASAKKFEPNTRVIVYDLGMRPRQLRKLKKKFDYEIRTFDYAKYPSFFNIKVAAGEFGWKPVIIEEVARECGGVVCWMDAGNIITAPLDAIVDETIRIGFYRLTTNHSILKWTHPGMLNYFETPENWDGGQDMSAGGCLAFNSADLCSMKLISNWSKYAKIKECLAPLGSNRGNHRQDQALLSILASLENWPPIDVNIKRPFAFHQDDDANIGQHIYRRYKRIRNWAKARFTKA